jgi:hypothetical protein
MYVTIATSALEGLHIKNGINLSHFTFPTINFVPNILDQSSHFDGLAHWLQDCPVAFHIPRNITVFFLRH